LSEEETKLKKQEKEEVYGKRKTKEEGKSQRDENIHSGKKIQDS